MVHDDGPVGLDRVQVAFDDERVVPDAGIVLVAALAARLASSRWLSAWCVSASAWARQTRGAR